MRRICFFLLMLLMGMLMLAQTRREVMREKMDSLLHGKYEKIDSVLLKRYEKISYDTAYIVRPSSKLMLKVRANISGNNIRMKNKVARKQVRANLSTARKTTFSFSVNYIGLSAGFALNPSFFSGKSKDFEINLNAYSNRYNIDVYYQFSKTLSGTIFHDDEKYLLDQGSMHMKVLNVSGYYTFNHRRFSYPAAFTQSYIQKRSAGSWMAGFSYQGGSMRPVGDVSAEMPAERIYMGNFAIGGGYGHNFIVKKWLLHASLLPAVIVLNNNNVTVNGEREDENTHFPEMIVNGRVAAVYNVNSKYFMGFTSIFSSSRLGYSGHYTRQNKWRVRMFLGIRL